MTNNENTAAAIAALAEALRKEIKYNDLDASVTPLELAVFVRDYNIDASGIMGGYHFSLAYGELSRFTNSPAAMTELINDIIAELS
jgi:hypothetical protein